MSKRRDLLIGLGGLTLADGRNRSVVAEDLPLAQLRLEAGANAGKSLLRITEP